MPERETKPWFASKSIIGSVVAVASLVGAFAGLDVDAASQQLVIDQAYAAIVAVVALVGTGLSIYGRIVAKKPIR